MSPNPPNLRITLGQCSRTGLRERNEDFHGSVSPSSPDALKRKGIALALADGVGGSGGGMEASQYAVGGFFADYYSTPDSWEVEKSATTVLDSINGWLHTQGRRASSVRGLVTTFSLLVLRMRQAHILHVGDTRVHLWREGRLEQLTTDHVSPNGNAVVRSLGLDSRVNLESIILDMAEKDRYVITSDGIHGVLSADDIAEIMSEERHPQAQSEVLANLALERGGQDNATCQVVRVDSLPLPSCLDLQREAKGLEFPPPLNNGDVLEGYEVLEDLEAGGMGCLYLACEADTRREVVLKCPSQWHENDPLYIERFMREEWVGRRVHSPNLVQIYAPLSARRSHLYLVMELCRGASARDRIDEHGAIPPDEVRRIGIQLCRALIELHRLNIIHRDIKPDNIMLSSEGSVKLVDYGIARLPAFDSITREGRPPGSPSYMAPEMLAGEPGNERTDVFALGVTLYELLSGKMPYGEIDDSGFVGASHKEYRTLPLSDELIEEWGWLDRMLERAVDLEPGRRFEVASEILFHLQHPEVLQKERLHNRKPLAVRDPVAFWKSISLILLLLNLVWLFIFGSLGGQ